MKGIFKLLGLSLFLALVLAPVLAYGVETAGKAPISQPLVREGTFAVKLAETLGVGKPVNEAEAETQLTAVGVAPRNGWIGDYPVTPDIVGELKTSVEEAAAAGRLKMAKTDASQSFDNVAASYNLAVNTGSAPAGVSEMPPPAYPDTSVADNYYYDEGPPVVTYYAPPPDYGYLYSWVPYPFWGWGFWYPGFFVLADFDFDHDHHDGHHDGDHHNGDHHGGRNGGDHHDGRSGSGGNHHDGHFTNHVRDKNTGHYSRIDPAGRASGGMSADRGSGSRWSSPSGQRGASAIFSRSLNGRAGGTTASSFNRGGTQYGGSGMKSANVSSRTYNGMRSTNVGSRANSGSSYYSGTRAYNGHSYYGNRSYGVPGGSRSYYTGRTFSAPSGFSRGSASLSGAGRSFGSGSFHGGSSSGGGSFGGRGGFSGGGRR